MIEATKKACLRPLMPFETCHASRSAMHMDKSAFASCYRKPQERKNRDIISADELSQRKPKLALNIIPRPASALAILSLRGWRNQRATYSTRIQSPASSHPRSPFPTCMHAFRGLTNSHNSDACRTCEPQYAADSICSVINVK